MAKKKDTRLSYGGSLHFRRKADLRPGRTRYIRKIYRPEPRRFRTLYRKDIAFKKAKSINPGFNRENFFKNEVLPKFRSYYDQNKKTGKEFGLYILFRHRGKGFVQHSRFSIGRTKLHNQKDFDKFIQHFLKGGAHGQPGFLQFIEGYLKNFSSSTIYGISMEVLREGKPKKAKSKRKKKKGKKVSRPRHRNKRKPRGRSKR